jgi:hypothetical protein
MLRGYRSSGGVLDAVELETRSRSDGAGVGGAFADWRRDGTLFAFEWRGRAWIPRFQLSPAYLPRDSVVRICNELRPVFDNWDLSIWFSQRNDALGGHVPADRVSIDPSSVHQAARLERFLGAG